MKTFLECKREAAKSLFGYDNFNMDDYSTRDFVEITDLAAKIYAESALDTAANEASLLLDEKRPYRVDDYPEHQRECLGDGRDGNILCYIDRDSILKLKDQLK